VRWTDKKTENLTLNKYKQSDKEIKRKNMEINNVKVCNPIETLINLLSENGFKVIEKELSDYHFHEMNIKIAGNIKEPLPNVEIEGITRHSENLFICACHWSRVEVVNEIER
jgi:hypothetical protein